MFFIVFVMQLPKFEFVLTFLVPFTTATDNKISDIFHNLLGVGE